MDLRLCTTFILLSLWASGDCFKDLNDMASWKVLEYGFDSDADRKDALKHGFLPNNAEPPFDVDVHYTMGGNLKMFITIPPIKPGVPYTLALVSNKRGQNGPTIYPYPGYSWHNKTDCTGITSAYRMAIDDCDRLWVLDSGLNGTELVCPPKLLTFDLKTDELVHQYQFSDNVYTSNSALVTPIVDVRDPPPMGQCKEVMAYVADIRQGGLLVYDSKRRTSWRIENELMKPDPNWQNHSIAGERFKLADGLIALSLTPRTSSLDISLSSDEVVDNERYLFFHPLASETEYKVALRYIDDQTIWQNNASAMPDAFIELGKRGIQAVMEAMDSMGNLYTNIYNPISVFRWNIHNRKYNPSVFFDVADNPVQLQFACGMKVVRNQLGQEELWASTCRYQKFTLGTLDPNDTNYRMLACRTDDILSGRECGPLGTQTGNLITSRNNK